ncbi:MAG: protein kinase [Labilithrix sp.]
MAGKYQDGHLIVGTVYRVVRHIGTGGMGSLYEVEDTTVGRHFVLKTLHPELIDREDLAVRMQQEARALGRLSHPNIVEVITAGVTGDAFKMPFYVMERLVGHNLRTVIDARRGEPGGVGIGNAYRICIDVLGALQHAHDCSMVHRDVKPENIFLHRSPSGATVTKLLDFGIVRMLNREASLTRGKFLGTLKYSSPEQITGTREIGPASDIYSLALVLYELLVGRGPFDDAGDAFKVGAAHAGQTPPPPSRFSRVAPGVEKLLLHCLEKQPEARPRSAGAFAAELCRALRDFDNTPSMATEVDLLTAQHPVEKGATLVSPTRTETAPNSTVTTPDTPGQVATRLEGAAKVAVADTVPAPNTAPAPNTPVMAGAPARPDDPPVVAVVGAGAVHGAPADGAGAAAAAGAAAGGLDREAPTRITPPSQPQIAVPQNDTQVAGATNVRATVRMDVAPAAGLAPPAMAHGAVASPPMLMPAPPGVQLAAPPGAPAGTALSAPGPGPAPATGPGPGPARAEQRYISTVHTRPRKDRALVALLAAAVVALAMIAGAVVLVRGRLTAK